MSEDASFGDRLDFVKLDLSLLKSAKEASAALISREDRIDGVVCNAGVMASPFELTADGIESQFQVNHLSHWLFVQGIMPLLEKTAKETGHTSRVVNLSSFAHNFVRRLRSSSAEVDKLTSGCPR